MAVGGGGRSGAPAPSSLLTFECRLSLNLVEHQLSFYLVECRLSSGARRENKEREIGKRRINKGKL